MSDKTPDILIPALRQYQHNDCSGLLAGFDYDETVKIIAKIEQHFIDKLMAAAESALENECVDVGPAGVILEAIERALKEAQSDGA